MKEAYDSETGEIIPPDEVQSRQIVEGIVPSTGHTGGDIINMLRDGAFQAEFHNEVGELVRYLKELSAQTGGKAKGSISIKLDFISEDSAVRIGDTMKVSKPELPKIKSIAWQDEQGNLTAFPPNQMRMFALKSAGGSGGIRNV